MAELPNLTTIQLARDENVQNGTVTYRLLLYRNKQGIEKFHRPEHEALGQFGSLDKCFQELLRGKLPSTACYLRMGRR